MGEETRAAVRAVETLERKDRVLIVEDEDNARKGYEQLLQRWGCDVLGVATEAAWLECKESTGRKKNTLLTHTGLLMEGTDNHFAGLVESGPFLLKFSSPVISHS